MQGDGQGSVHMSVYGNRSNRYPHYWSLVLLKIEDLSAQFTSDSRPELKP